MPKDTNSGSDKSGDTNRNSDMKLADAHIWKLEQNQNEENVTESSEVSSNGYLDYVVPPFHLVELP
jgi:hypothetical protein